MQDPTPHYQALARVAASVCGADFHQAEIVAQVDEGHAEIAYHCEGSGGRNEGVDSSFDDDRAAKAALHALRDTTPGAEKWSRATFVLRPDGTFKFAVGYQD